MRIVAQVIEGEGVWACKISENFRNHFSQKFLVYAGFGPGLPPPGGQGLFGPLVVLNKRSDHPLSHGAACTLLDPPIAKRKQINQKRHVKSWVSLEGETNPRIVEVPFI